VNAEGLGHFLPRPAVEPHQGRKGAGLLDGLQVLAQTVLDELLLQDLRRRLLVPKAKSDAYATGQALYALAEAGAKPDDEAVRKAQSFPAKTQREDGAWAMVSRAIMRDGKPPKNLEPITHAGSAWAVLGLIRSSPSVAKLDRTDAK
jgi:hypothetical protein